LGQCGIFQEFRWNVGTEIGRRLLGLLLLRSLDSLCYPQGHSQSDPAMFLRVVRAAGGHGITHEYVRVVEAFRQNGKTRHRTILNLGRRDLLAAHLDFTKLMRLLHGDATASLRPARAI
jgi:hypothetical protein